MSIAEILPSAEPALSPAVPDSPIVTATTPATAPDTAPADSAAPGSAAPWPGTDISVFDLFSIGIGPSSSHTVGPMRAAARFATALTATLAADPASAVSLARIQVDLFGSLAATGRGHGTDRAVLLGLEGHDPATIDPDEAVRRVEEIRAAGSLLIAGQIPIALTESTDVRLHRRQCLPVHPNGMRFTAFSPNGTKLAMAEFYSIGGGFIVDGDSVGLSYAGGTSDGPHSSAAPVSPPGSAEPMALPMPFASAARLLELAATNDMSISQVMLTNEKARRGEAEIRDRLVAIWHAMAACVNRGRTTKGTLPGGLLVPRRAAALSTQLGEIPDADDPLRAMDWVSLYALAVNEENAAGGRVVTAPTNGAAGIVPAVLHYYHHFVPGADLDGIVRFLLTAGAIGALCKHNASISGAEVGCQGEVGSACAMAAAGLAEVLGGTPAQVENAAEIAMEHNLGLTCDPIGGLVQIPCIERNAVASIKAITAARIALRGDGSHHVSLDRVIRTMLATGRDMKDKYKETSRGGLAINLPEC